MESNSQTSAQSLQPTLDQRQQQAPPPPPPPRQDREHPPQRTEQNDRDGLRLVLEKLGTTH
jgi:hypothetical protein